jgi:dienelactone hydrolase
VRRAPAGVGRSRPITAAAVAAVLALLAVAPAARGATGAPEDFGRHAVAVTRVQVPVPPDPGGPEGALPSVAADVYVPSGRRRFPLVQISHAWPGTLREFPLSGWARRLASRGFVVIVSDRRAASSLAVTPALDQPVDVVDLSSAVNSEDVLRVLRWAIAQGRVKGSVLSGKVDRRHLAIAGHSLGAYMATFAAVRAQTEGPYLSALLLLDPSDERLGTLTRDSSLAQTPLVKQPTLVLASEENQHPVMCNMDDGTDCTLIAPQQYAALGAGIVKLGLKVIGSVHEDVEDPSTIGTPESLAHLATYERYGMAWLELWVAHDCRAAPYLGGAAAREDERAGRIAAFPGATAIGRCRRAHSPSRG